MNPRRKGKLQVLGNIGGGYHQTNKYERRNNKRVQQEKDEKTPQNQTLLQKSHQEDKHLGSPVSKILKIILNIDKGLTETNGLKDKNTDD